MRKEKEVGDELAFVNGDALDVFADFLLEIVDGFDNGPRITGRKFKSRHLGVAVGIAAFDETGTALGVVAGLENQNVLLGVLAAHISAAEQLCGFIAAHGAQHQFNLARHPGDSVGRIWLADFHHNRPAGPLPVLQRR